MSERSEPRVTPLRLVLDFGETVELDGSNLYDPTSETAARRWFSGCRRTGRHTSAGC